VLSQTRGAGAVALLARGEIELVTVRRRGFANSMAIAIVRGRHRPERFGPHALDVIAN